MAAYNSAPFANPALNSNSMNINPVISHNVVDTSIPPPFFPSNNGMQSVPLNNQPAGQHFNFGQPSCTSHVPSLNNIGSPFPTRPPNNMQSQNISPNQSAPVWRNSFQNNGFVNNSFSGPSHPSNFQLNVSETANFQNAPPPQTPRNAPAGPPPIWQNNNSFNNTVSPNYIHKSDNVTLNHPVVHNQNQTLPPPNFHSAQIPQNTFPLPTNSMQYSNSVWKSNNVNGNPPNNNSTNHVQFNNFDRNQNTDLYRQSNQRSHDFLKIQKTNVPDLNIFNNPEVVFNMSGNNVMPEKANVNPNQFIQNSYTESFNSFNPLQSERVNQNNNNNQWNKEPFNTSPRKEQFGNKNNHKPFKVSPQFNNSRNRPMSQPNHQNLIDIQVLSDDNDFNHKGVKQEDQNISSQTTFIERKNFAFHDTNNFTNHKRFSNTGTDNSDLFNKHSLNSFQNSNNTFEDQDNFRNKQSWMSDDIRMALKERNSLFFEAKRTNDPAVWEKYNILKSQIDEDIRKAKFGSGFRAKSFNSRYRRPIEKDLPFACDMCDRSFSTDEEYKAHCALHIKCDYAGCNFEAHPKIVFLHQKMQHETGYAEAINKLQNDEEIKKWREERKKNFPTAENILKRKAERAEKEARGEVVQDQNFGRFKRQRTGPGNFRQDRFKHRDRRFRQRPKNKYSYIKESFEVQCQAMNNQNSDSEAESEDHIKLPRFTGIKEELEPLPSDLIQDSKNDENVLENHISNSQDENKDNDTPEVSVIKQVSHTSKSQEESEGDDVQEIPISEQTVNNLSKSEDENEGDDVQEIPISEQTVNNLSKPEDENEDLDDDSPLEIPISKVPLHEVPESFDDDEENIVEHSQSINGDDSTAPETLSKGDLPDNDATVKEEEHLSTSGQENKDLENSKRRRYEKNSNRKAPRPVPPTRRKNSLLGMLLQDEIRHERNVIMQCVRHIVRNKFFGIGNDNGDDSKV